MNPLGESDTAQPAGPAAARPLPEVGSPAPGRADRHQALASASEPTKGAIDDARAPGVPAGEAGEGFVANLSGPAGGAGPAPRLQRLGVLGRGSLWWSPLAAADALTPGGAAVALPDADAASGGVLTLRVRWPEEMDAPARAALCFSARATQAWPDVLRLRRVDDSGEVLRLMYAAPPGQLLSQWLAQHGHPDRATALRWTRSLCAALLDGHALGLAHGLARPSAVWLDERGRVRWLGAGLSAVLDPDPRATLDGADALDALDAPGAPDAPDALGNDVRALGGCMRDWLAAGGATADDLAPLDAALAGTGTTGAAEPASGSTVSHRAGHGAGPVDAGFALGEALLQAIDALWREDAPPPLVTDADHTDTERATRARATLADLMQRMRYRSDFPALSERVSRIQALSQAEHEPLQRLAEEILHDVALTQKLLRVVNAASARRSGGQVATVSRAVALVGVAGVRNLALSLILLEHLQDPEGLRRLRTGFARALLAGEVAQRLAVSRHDAEDAHLGAVFYNLGPLLATYYFPDVADDIARRHVSALTPHTSPAASDRLLDRTAIEQLGLGYWDLGLAIARHWGLPDALQAAMQPPDDDPPPARAAGERRALWMARAANTVAATMWSAAPADWPEALRPLAPPLARTLGLRAESLLAAAEAARERFCELAGPIGLSDELPAVWSGEQAANAPLSAATGGQDASAQALRASVNPDRAGRQGASAANAANATSSAVMAAGAPGGRDARLVALSAAIQELTDAQINESPGVQQVLGMVIEAIYRGLGCRQVVLALRDATGTRLQGRMALGGDERLSVAARAQCVQVPLAASDALAQACRAGEDLWIERLAGSRGPWPQWLREEARPASFVALPLCLRGRPVAVVYADHGQPSTWSEPERALVGALRSQALLALRAAGASPSS